MRTSEDVRNLGVYASECCGEEMIFETGDTFCRCPRCHRLCQWGLIKTLVTAAQFEDLETKAA